MKIGDTYTITVGRDTPIHAAHLVAVATASLRMATRAPIPPGDLDAIVSDMWTTTATLHEVTARLAQATVEPHVKDALTAAERALEELRRALHRADPESEQS